jgi:peptide/nickel transport system substrate-binding protein
VKFRRISAVSAVVAAGALALSSCSTPGAQTSIDQGTSVTVGWNQAFYEYNTLTATGNATANSIINYMMNGAFNYYDKDLKLVPDESYGTYEKVSDDPLTVKYTVGDNTTWSDGVPVTAADILLVWAGQSGTFNNVEPVYDPDTGEITNQDALDAGVYFNSSSPGLALVTETPTISDDGKSLTLVYSKPFADWEVALTGAGVPAHVTAQHALGIEDPTEATDALVKAIQDGDVAKLSPISTFWSSGFQYVNMPDDASLYTSNGAYVLTDLVENQYLTLVANPEFTGDRKASIERVTIRYNEDPMAQVQALQNGELDLISPQSTADVLAAVNALADQGIQVKTGVEGTYEHVDLVFNNGGPFDPATYGGDADKAFKVRQAFLKTIPRQGIVDTLIKPLNPDAEVRNSFLVVPGSPTYADMVANNNSSQYGPVDIAGAQALLAEVGVTTPIDVRMLFGQTNQRRQDEFALMQASATQAGFNLIDASAVQWGPLLSDTTLYDVSLFGWQSQSTAVTESQANYVTGGQNNFGGYSNTDVDSLYDQLVVSTDPDTQHSLQVDIEKNLWNDAFGVTIFQFPGVTAFNKNVSGIDPIAISPTIFWNFWEWKTTGDTAASPTATAPAVEVGGGVGGRAP